MSFVANLTDAAIHKLLSAPRDSRPGLMDTFTLHFLIQLLLHIFAVCVKTVTDFQTCRPDGQEVEVEAAEKVEFEKHRSIRCLSPIYHPVPSPGELFQVKLKIKDHTYLPPPALPFGRLGMLETDGRRDGHAGQFFSSS